jgi:hypothetical protein
MMRTRTGLIPCGVDYLPNKMVNLKLKKRLTSKFSISNQNVRGAWRFLGPPGDNFAKKAGFFC